jgi:hypothetical protein
MTAINYPYDFSNGTIADATQVNDNFGAVSDVVNGNLDTTNLSASAGITVSQLGLDPGGTAFNKQASGVNTWASGLTTDTQPRVTMTTDAGIKFGPGGSGTPDVELVRSAANTVQLNNTSGGAANLDLNGGALQNASISFSSLAVSGGLSTGENTGASGSVTLYGSSSGNAVLTVGAVAGDVTFQLPGTNGSSGQVLSTNGAGVLSWVSSINVQKLGPYTLAQNSYITIANPFEPNPPSNIWLVGTNLSEDVGLAAGYFLYDMASSGSPNGIFVLSVPPVFSQIQLGTNVQTAWGQGNSDDVLDLAKWEWYVYVQQ